MFRDREAAGRKLAEKLKGRELHDPLVLAPIELQRSNG